MSKIHNLWVFFVKVSVAVAFVVVVGKAEMYLMALCEVQSNTDTITLQYFIYSVVATEDYMQIMCKS